MFERDKDDLRRIGILIEVRGVDPGFEDEPGYRVRSETYALNLGELNGAEVALLSLAAEAWRGAALGEPAQSALAKLRSLGIDSDFDGLPNLSPKFNVSSPNFVPLTRAIADQTTIAEMTEQCPGQFFENMMLVYALIQWDTKLVSERQQ